MGRGVPANTPGQLFQLFREAWVATRRELAETTELSRSTVAARVDQLLAAGYLREGGTATSSGGRPPAILTVDDSTPTVLAADLGATHGRLAVAEASGRLLAEEVIESRIASGPEAVLSRVADRFDALLAGTGRTPASLCGIGLGVPGPVDFVTARAVRPPIMPGWHDFGVRELLGRRFDCPVLLDNDANMMALGEQRLARPSAASLVFVKVGTGIGAGIMVGGQLLRGIDGAEGDLGHVRLRGNEHVCACGATGCLATRASGAAMARELREQGLHASTSRDVVALVQHGNPVAVSLVRAAGLLLGEVLATAVALINPDVLVIGGDIADTGEHFLRGVHEALLQRTQPLATRQLQVTTSKLGDRAGVAGAVVMVRDRVFSAEVVDARLRGAVVENVS